MDLERDSYKLSSKLKSIEPSDEFEGLNCLRFALSSLILLRDSQLSGRLRELLFQVGYRRNFPALEELLDSNSFSENDIGRIESKIRAIIQSLQEIDYESVRRQIWEDVIESPMDHGNQIGLLLVGLYSPLERESFISAIALHKFFLHISDETFPNRIWRRVVDPKRPYIEYLYSNRIDLVGRAAINFPFDNDSRTAVEHWKSIKDDFMAYYSNEHLLQQLRRLALEKLSLARISRIPFIHEILDAATKKTKDTEVLIPSAAPTKRRRDTSIRKRPVSTLIHGSFAWKQGWWTPQGQFFKYIRKSLWSDLYREGREFSWSGNFIISHRKIAAVRFYKWSQQNRSLTELNGVISHSYGSDICARSVYRGLRLNHAVFMSAPATNYLVESINSIPQIVDIRLKFDFVIWAADEDQYLPVAKNVKQIIPRRSYWNHSITHDPDFWEREKIVQKIWKLIP